MIYLKNNLEVDLNLFEQSRPDLWPMLIENIKEQSPGIYELYANNETVAFLKEQFRGRLLIMIEELHEKAQIIIIRAVKERQGKNTKMMKPFKFKNARPDLWPEFLKQLKKKDPIMFELTQSDHLESLHWFVDDIPAKAQTIVTKASYEAMQKLKQQNT